MKNGKQVASAQNLEVILRYQRIHSSIKSVKQDGYNLIVKYDDGATVNTKFADKSVLSNWIYKKKGRGVFPISKQAEKLKRKKIQKNIKKTLNYKNMKLKNIRRTGKQTDGTYIYEGRIIPQGIGVATTLKAKNLDDYFRKIKKNYNNR